MRPPDDETLLQELLSQLDQLRAKRARDASPGDRILHEARITALEKTIRETEDKLRARAASWRPGA